MKLPCKRNSVWKWWEISRLTVAKLPCKRNDFSKRFEISNGLELTSSLIWMCSYIISRTIFNMLLHQLNPFSTNVPLTDKPSSWFLLAKTFEKHLWKRDTLSKDARRIHFLRFLFKSSILLSLNCTILKIGLILISCM